MKRARKWVDDWMRRGIVSPRGVCEDGAAGERSGRRAEVQCAALAPQTRALVAYTSRQGHQKFSKMTVFF
jgi:hypothetical protein